SGSGSMFGGTADLFVKVNDLCVAVFLDRDRSISEKLTFDHLHPSERVAALRIDLPDCHERCNSDPHPTPEIRSRG
ncbi:hypothetical protein NNE30_27380, partial [Escherichia coli]|nr:hypothetical protein [Escherichia coli]